jgi:hypothetical protein
VNLGRKKKRKTSFKKVKYAKFKAGYSDRVEERRKSISKIEPSPNMELRKENNQKIDEFFKNRKR